MRNPRPAHENRHFRRRRREVQLRGVDAVFLAQHVLHPPEPFLRGHLPHVHVGKGFPGRWRALVCGPRPDRAQRDRNQNRQGARTREQSFRPYRLSTGRPFRFRDPARTRPNARRRALRLSTAADSGERPTEQPEPVGLAAAGVGELPGDASPCPVVAPPSRSLGGARGCVRGRDVAADLLAAAPGDLPRERNRRPVSRRSGWRRSPVRPAW